jgi:hypothetical protein
MSEDVEEVRTEAPAAGDIVVIRLKGIHSQSAVDAAAAKMRALLEGGGHRNTVIAHDDTIEFYRLPKSGAAIAKARPAPGSRPRRRA